MEKILDYVIEWLALAVMLFGLLGLIIPILPGLLIIWAAALFGWRGEPSRPLWLWPP